VSDANDAKEASDVGPERPGDEADIRAVHREAFATDEEVALVDGLEAAPSFDPALSLVARDGDAVVGHALLSPLDVEGDWRALVLAPVAVRPAWQDEGFGSALVRAALDAARRAGVDGVFLHGAPSFYRRFGFQPAGDHGFENPFDTPPEVFMLALLSDRTPPGGPLEYPAAFDVLSE
jgi:putative acetyltransferase